MPSLDRPPAPRRSHASVSTAAHRAALRVTVAPTPAPTPDQANRHAPPFPGPHLGEWFVLHTRSRQEKALAVDLIDRGVSCFLPLHRPARSPGPSAQRRPAAALPYFPGYLFLRGSLEQAFIADRTRRVAAILRVADQAQLDHELRQLHLALARGARLDPHACLTDGAPARVRQGPLRGLEGVIEIGHAARRLVLRVQLLGQALSVEALPTDLELLQPGAASAPETPQAARPPGRRPTQGLITHDHHA